MEVGRIKKLVLLGFIFSSLLVLTGCTDFTRYKTGKVLEKGKKRVTYPDIAAVNNEEVQILVLPKVGMDYGLGNGVEAGWRIASTSVSGDIRKQLLYEKKSKVNFAVESGVSIGTVSYGNYGGTLSYNNKHVIFGDTQEYIGIHHNVYFDSHDESRRLQLIKERFRNDSNIQFTVGRQFFPDDVVNIFLEGNFYKYTEKDKEDEEPTFVLSIGVTHEY